jgi:hypothetical protein
MRHVPRAGAARHLPFAGSGDLVAVAKSRIPVPQYAVVVLGRSQARRPRNHHRGRSGEVSVYVRVKGCGMIGARLMAGAARLNNRAA